MNENIIRNFFNETKKSISDTPKEYEDLMFILVNEFHWSQKDIAEAELPFVYELLNARKRMIQEQERQSKRRR
ncbi:MAG TPA: hypothetical protein V6C58_06570 [Allocoleopsis sp.]